MIYYHIRLSVMSVINSQCFSIYHKVLASLMTTTWGQYYTRFNQKYCQEKITPPKYMMDIFKATKGITFIIK